MGYIPDEIVREIVGRCDIVEVVSSYIKLRRTGRNFKAVCPFHNEKTASFVVNPEKQIFHCFGCGVGGDVVSFVMKYERIDFVEAVKMLAASVNVVVPETGKGNKLHSDIRQSILKINAMAADYFHRMLLSDTMPAARQGREYLKSRGVSLDCVRQFNLGFSLNEWDALLNYLRGQDVSLDLMEKAGVIIAKANGDGFYDRFRGRIMFPIFDARGLCRAFGGRILKQDGKGGSAKYVNSPETEVYTKGSHLYGLNLARHSIASNDSVIVVEGYLDCIIPFQAGVQNIVASLGTALTVSQVRLIKRYTDNIILLFDMDPAGESAMLRSMDMLIEEGMNVKAAALDYGDDPDSFIRKHGIDAFRTRISSAVSLFDYKLNMLKRRYKIDSIEEKAKLAGDMLSTIAKFRNAVVVSGYVSRLAQEIRVSENALISELNKITDKRRWGKDSISENSNDQYVMANHCRVSRNVERDMLCLLFEDTKIADRLKNDISLQEFQDDKVRIILEKVYEICESGNNFDVVSLLRCFTDSDIRRVISEIAASSTHIVGDKERLYRDYVARIKSDRLKLERKSLLVQMKRAESLGEYERLQELRDRFWRLVKS